MGRSAVPATPEDTLSHRSLPAHHVLGGTSTICPSHAYPNLFASYYLPKSIKISVWPPTVLRSPLLDHHCPCYYCGENDPKISHLLISLSGCASHPRSLGHRVSCLGKPFLVRSAPDSRGFGAVVLGCSGMECGAASCDPFGCI